MRVAYILPYLERPSGWRSHSIALLAALRPAVEPVLFVAAGEAQQAAELFRGCEIYSLPVTQQASARSPRGAARLGATWIKVWRGKLPHFDLVHSLEAYPTGLIGSWLAQRAGCPHVLTAHGTYGLVWRDSAPDRILYERVLRSAVAVLPVSQGTAGLMQQHFPRALQGVRVQPILNGNTFYKNVPDEWALTRPFPRPPVILTVGDVKPRKGQHASLAAFAQVQQRLPGTQYEIAGKFWDNAYYRGLQQMIAEQNLRGVRFHGMVSVEELQALYRSASVFVLAAQPEGLHVEGFGLVYLEAGAYGLPVVGTATGGVPDAVLHGETGLLAAPGDVGGLADGILSILQDETLARRLGQANRRRSEELTWEHCAEEHLQVYQEVV